jgi:hypothetical protein
MRTTVCCVLFFLIASCAAQPVSADVIAGSVLRSPLQFQSNSFFGISTRCEEAFPFRVIAGNRWLPDRLEVPLYHYEDMPGSSALFAICTDISGRPGSPIATFPVSSITTIARIYSATPSYVACPLQGDATYWLVGTTAAGQVNWNLESDCFEDATRAYRDHGGDWVVQSDLGNVSAFAIYGSAVPEPSGIVLLGIGVISVLANAWRRRFVQGNHE